MKAGVLPRFFACQKDRARTAHPAEIRPAAAKLQRKRILANMLEEKSKPNTNHATKEMPQNIQPAEGSNPSQCESDASVAGKSSITTPVKRRVKVCNAWTATEESQHAEEAVPVPVQNVESCSSLKHSPRESTILPQDGSFPSVADAVYEYVPSVVSTPELIPEELLGSISRNSERRLERISKKPNIYIGVTDEWFFLLELLSRSAKIPLFNIILTMEKIKNNLPFDILGDEYDISAQQAAKLFRATVPIMAHFFGRLVFWPSKSRIQAALPLAFRAQYQKVQSIINCLEIEIEQPSNSLHQASTWSNYKKCNTAKFLISATPDGFINFVSEGFGGRCSDTEIVKNSKFLDVLPQKCHIMADQGFNHLESFLQGEKGCVLVRSPTARNNGTPTKEQVKETNRIVSLRIHTERVVKQFREFAFLKPHAAIPIQSVDLLSDVVKIAAALINVQSPVIN